MALAQQREIRIYIHCHHFAPFLSGELLDAFAAGENAGVQYQHIEPTEAAHGFFQRIANANIAGYIAHQAKIIGAFEQRFDRWIDIEPDHRRAARQQRFDAGFADAGSCAGDQRDLAGKNGRLAALLQLGLLQVPIFHIENVFRRQCVVST